MLKLGKTEICMRAQAHKNTFTGQSMRTKWDISIARWAQVQFKLFAWAGLARLFFKPRPACCCPNCVGLVGPVGDGFWGWIQYSVQQFNQVTRWIRVPSWSGFRSRGGVKLAQGAKRLDLLQVTCSKFRPARFTPFYRLQSCLALAAFEPA